MKETFEEQEDFEDLARQVHKEREKQEQFKFNSIEFKAKKEMVFFRLWCYANGKCDDEKTFKEYISQIPQIDFWVRKKIAETYFDYEYNFDYKNSKWIAVKKDVNNA